MACPRNTSGKETISGKEEKIRETVIKEVVLRQSKIDRKRENEPRKSAIKKILLEEKFLPPPLHLCLSAYLLIVNH